MSDQLTQAEIDALREAVRTGKLEEVAENIPAEQGTEIKVVTYDFRKPKLLSAERMVKLQLVHQTLIKNLQSMLFSMFKIAGESSLVALEQVSYGEYVLSLSSPTYLNSLDASPDVGPIGVELSPPMGQVLLDMLLGGDGVAPASAASHEFSAFELEIMRTLSDRLLEEMENAWRPVYDVTFKVSGHGVSPEQVQIAPPDTPCLIAVIDSRLEVGSMRMHICYPFRSLQTIFERAESARSEQSNKRQEIRKQVLRALQYVPLPLNVELGRARMTARELDSLAVGDIIKLDHSTGDPLMLKIGERTIGCSHVGAHRGRLAACVEKVVSPSGNGHAKPPDTAAGPATPPPPSAGATPPPKPTPLRRGEATAFCSSGQTARPPTG